MKLTLYDLSHLRYRNLISSPVEDGSIVVDVLNFDRNGADALQRGSTTVARLHKIGIMSNLSSNKRTDRHPSGGGTIGLRYRFKDIGLFHCCGSVMLTTRIPVPNFFHLKSRIRIKEFKYFDQKLFLSSRKYDPPGSRFLPIPEPGVKKAPDSGSGFATLVYSSIQIRVKLRQ